MLYNIMTGIVGVAIPEYYCEIPQVADGKDWEKSLC